MNQIAEECLQAVVLPELERGRPGWDKPHTELGVAYIKEIVAAETELELDEEILVIAMYGHDWGYAGLFDHRAPKNLEDIKERKEEHMRLGASMMAKLLAQRGEFDYLSLEQKRDICRLIFVHDRVEKLRDPHELVLMEADTLSALDARGVRGVFSEKERERYKARAMRKRVSRFITDYSRARVQELVAPDMLALAERL